VLILKIKSWKFCSLHTHTTLRSRCYEMFATL